jgi:CheY-like chemotaxis protein
MSPLQILVAEDDAIIAMLLSDVLADLGHAICAVVATEDALVDAALRFGPGLMIVDARLRDGSGVAAVERVLRRGFVPHVFVTGAVLDRKTLSPRAVLLQKPYAEADLVRAVQAALGAGVPA